MSQVVAITGAAGGIGAALAHCYAREGARLVLLDLDGDAVERLAEVLVGAGVEVLSMPCDVTDLDACNAAVARIEVQFGRLDVLVNNAGITHFGAFENTDIEVLRRVMDVNLFGSINMTKAALAPLLASRGQVIAISSVAGFCPLPLRAGYAASKHAMRGFFDTLRCEVQSRGLKVMIACPFFVESDIARNALSGDGRGRAPEVEASRLKGMVTAEHAAREIVRGAKAGRRFLPVARGAKLAWVLSRLAPGLLAKLSADRVYKDEGVG